MRRVPFSLAALFAAASLLLTPIAKAESHVELILDASGSMFNKLGDGRYRIVVTELPYQVNKAKLIESIAHLHRDKVVEGITGLRDESDRTGMRIVIEVSRNAMGQVVLNNLFAHTDLQTTFGVIMLALVDGVPRTLRLPEMLYYYIEHQKDVITRRTRYDLRKAEERERLKRENERLRSELSRDLTIKNLIGTSEQMQEVVRQVRKLAPVKSTALITGESGTGKELFAHAIHNASRRQGMPFVAINCAAIPAELLETELFGYDEGAFSGAKRGGKPGKFELSAGGTLFLDEIGDMPLEQQISLLRVIQEKKVMRIGGDKMIPVNVRLICATNKNLRKEVEKGSFRQDLFYRLNVVTITIPPLRDRRQDIPLLFACFMEKLGRDRRCNFYVEPEVTDCLQQYNWPGNVRELQNVVERAASLAENGVIALRHLPAEIGLPAGHLSSVALLPAVSSLDCREQRQKLAKDAERHRILTLLDVHAGNVSQVARELGVSRKTLYDKMRRHAIKN